MVIQELIDRLYAHGYSKEDIEKILSGYDLGYAQALIDTNNYTMKSLLRENQELKLSIKKQKPD